MSAIRRGLVATPFITISRMLTSHRSAQGVIYADQLQNAKNQERKENFDLFVSNLNPDKYHVAINTEGNCNYAFIVILNDANLDKRKRVLTKSNTMLAANG